MENNGLGNDESNIIIANTQERIFRTERQAFALWFVDAMIERNQRLSDVPVILLGPAIEMIRLNTILMCPVRLLYLRNYYGIDNRINDVSTRLRDLFLSSTNYPMIPIISPRIVDDNIRSIPNGILYI
jgi:hypothetical protein